MVKIPDLTNKQLVSQIEKYQKILDQLLNERNKRASVNNTDDLYTKKELENRAPAPEVSEGDNLLNFDDEEISKMEEEAKKTKIKDEDDEEVRVTQLLKLSKEDLAALQANKKKISKKG